MNLKRSIMSFVLLLCLTGCGYESLYTELDERQANEMLVLLLADNLSVKKTSEVNGWKLETKVSDLPRAVEILRAHGLPRDDFQTLGEVFKKEGFVSSPLEEKARLLFGLSQELSNTISTIDGVIVARVHIAIPEKNVLSEDRVPSSASVFIKHRTESKIDTQLASIKALVVNSVEGLPYDNVTVTLFPSEVVLSVDTHSESSAYDLNLHELLQQDFLLLFSGLIIFLIVIVFLLLRKRSSTKTTQLVASSAVDNS